MEGDGEIIARVTSQTDTNEWAKAGIVIKASPSAGSDYVSMYTSPDHGIRFQHGFDTDTGGNSYTFPNTWLKLVRNGTTITGYYSSNGTSWTQVDSTTLSLPTTVTVGLYVSSVDYTTASTAVFDNVTVTPTSTTNTVYKYAHTSGADTPDLLLNSSNQVVEKYVQLPGALLTIRPNASPSASQRVFSLRSVGGHTMATTDATGVQVDTFQYDPFGNKVSTNLPDNAAGGTTFGWAGTRQKFTETTLTLAPTQMGARVYLSQLGRFLQVDPIEGGTANTYVYVNDPINMNDYSGKASCPANIFSLLGCIFNQSKPAPKKPASAKPSAIGGFLHWLTGKGQALVMKAKAISWSVSTDDLKRAGTGKVNTTVRASARGFDGTEHVGRLTGAFVGSITRTSTGYRAIGTFTPNNDSYDFNNDPSRGLFANQATAIGRNGGALVQLGSGGIIMPTDYYIIFEGSASVDQSW